MTFYTLVTAHSPQGVTLLIGSPLDGDTKAIDAAVAGHREMEREYRSEDDDAGREAKGEDRIELISGCILTDEEPEDESSIVWSGHEAGWLIDETGRTYRYAVCTWSNG